MTPTELTDDQIAATELSDSYAAPFVRAPVVLVVSVDLGVVAATDQLLDRVGLVSGASVYPLVWNVLLGAREAGFGGTFTTMAVAEEPRVRELLGLPDSHAVAAVVSIGKPVKQLTSLRRSAVHDFVTVDRYSGRPLTGPGA